jgi:hypothetical protein
MTKRKDDLPEDASEIERAVKRAQELGIVCSLNPPPLSLLYELIARKELESKRGQGNWPGTEHKDRRDEDDLDLASQATRRYRDKKKREEEQKRLTAVIRGPYGENMLVRLDEGPPDPLTAGPTEHGLWFWAVPVNLHDEHFEFENYYTGTRYSGHGDRVTGDLAVEQERDAAWYDERRRQKRARWLARKRIDK